MNFNTFELKGRENTRYKTTELVTPQKKNSEKPNWKVEKETPKIKKMLENRSNWKEIRSKED